MLSVGVLVVYWFYVSFICNVCTYLLASEKFNVSKFLLLSSSWHAGAWLKLHFDYMKFNVNCKKRLRSFYSYYFQVKAVHICEATLTKRLIEFENTTAGSLTVSFIDTLGTNIQIYLQNCSFCAFWSCIFQFQFYINYYS